MPIGRLCAPRALMNPPAKPPPPPALDARNYPPMPPSWRLGLIAVVVGLTAAAYAGQGVVGPRGQAAVGILAFFTLGAAFSANLRSVNWRTIGWGIGLQALLALAVIKGKWTIEKEVIGPDGAPTTVTTEYSVYAAFERVGDVVKKFIGFSDEGARFVFGNLANPGDIALTSNAKPLFMFAFKALPPILFVSAFFTVLYHFGVLQWLVRVFARVMMYLMGTSGAETLSVAANVFMGQTEAPLSVKPYVARMPQSELSTLMVGGMCAISGGMMAVEINYGVDPVAVITTCIMACPCSLYLAKLVLPETDVPETAGVLHKDETGSPYVNAIDAAAAGTGDGLRLALNVAAMLIVFVAFVAMFDALLAGIKPTLLALGLSADALAGWPDDLSLRKLFGWPIGSASCRGRGGS